MIRSIFALSALAILTLPSGHARATPPVGYLDAASCDVIAGWSQDPDEPAAPIAVHIYFGGPAGTPGAPGVAVSANQYREDLCGAIGSCEHGFVALSPLSLHDGQAREVYAYGIDTAMELNPLLGNSPKVLQCAPAAQSGVRRRVDGAAAYDEWRFSSFWDLLPLGAAEADALPIGPDLSGKPELVRADDGMGQVWLVENGVRRAVSGAAAVNWRFDLGAVVEKPAAEVYALVEGTPVRPRPVLFVRGALYLADDPQPEGQSSGSSSAGTGGVGGGNGPSATGSGNGGGPSGGGNEENGSCALRTAGGRMGGSEIGADIFALIFGAGLLTARAWRRGGARLV